MKKLLKGIICFILIVMIVGVATSTLQTIVKNRKKPGSTSALPEGTYRITYKVAGSGEDLTKNFSWLMKEQGSYPKTYESTKGATVSTLAGAVSYVTWEGMEGTYAVSPVYDPEDSDHSAYFFAWYLDSDCTKEFDGEISAGTKGDVTLYAKIEEDWESNWTKFY